MIMGRFYAYTLELGKEAILEKFVWNDVLTAPSFSHNIGFSITSSSTKPTMLYR